MPWAKKIMLKFPLPKTFIGFVNIRYSFLFPTLAVFRDHLSSQYLKSKSYLYYFAESCIQSFFFNHVD